MATELNGITSAVDALRSFLRTEINIGNNAWELRHFQQCLKQHGVNEDLAGNAAATLIAENWLRPCSWEQHHYERIADQFGRRKIGIAELMRQAVLRFYEVGDAALLAAGVVSSTPPDESAFVPAKTLYQQRGMTAPKCNKFLTRFGTESVQPVEGKIRNRPNGKNRREIHAGDWNKFWEYVDRRQFEFINEDAIQAFLANVETRKAAVKSAKKKPL